MKKRLTMQEINSGLSKDFLIWLRANMCHNKMVFSELNEFSLLGQRICTVFSNISEIHQALKESEPVLNEQNFLYNLWLKSIKTSEGIKKSLANNPRYQKLINN